jgi:5S rRNA maturation endonuclease (ribonuclease M5)
LRSGQWKDYADPEMHGDLINLIQHCQMNGDLGKAIERAKEYIGYNDDNFEMPKYDDKKVPNQANFKNAKYAYYLWMNAEKKLGYPALRYLKKRKIFIPEYYSNYIVRYYEKLKHRDGGEYAALVFRVTTEGQKEIGLHRIYLTDEGDKIPEDAKLSIGPILGGAIKFGKSAAKVLIIDEGAEDTLSLCPLIRNHNIAIWGCTGVEAASLLIIPDHIERVIISTNNDHTAHKIMNDLQEKYSHSKEITFHLPPKEYGDYNKMLLETSRQEVMKYFDVILN